MSLRNRLPDEQSLFPDPELGINLRKDDQDLMPGEAKLMQNCFFEAGTQTRPGTTRLTPASLGAFAIRGGHKHYYGTTSSARVVSYGTKVVTVNDAGAETILTSGMTSNLDTHFTSWSITDKLYTANGTDKLFEWNGTLWQAVDVLGGAVAVPNGCKMVKPVLDRLLALTSAGLIERSNPRVAHIWSSNSAWATFRPQLGGPFTSIHPHSLRSVGGDVFSGAIATQANALYMITGTNYGSDVTAASASTGEDSSIKLLDSRIGTSSPYSLCTVPGVGVFGVSSDLNVWWLPFGEASPRIIGDKVRSKGSIPGLESANLASIGQIWMQYFDRKLWIGYPVGSDNFCSKYFWLDMRSFQEHPDRGPVWYGPHSGFSVNRCWVESQFTDNRLMGGEGNSANGAFLYNLYQAGVTTDAVATVDNVIDFDFWTHFHDFNTPSHEKYLQALQLNTQCFTGTPAVALYDLTGQIATGLTLTAI